MLISDVIKRLENNKELLGDLPVWGFPGHLSAELGKKPLTIFAEKEDGTFYLVCDAISYDRENNENK